jgi:hypothetical protein
LEDGTYYWTVVPIDDKDVYGAFGDPVFSFTADSGWTGGFDLELGSIPDQTVKQGGSTEVTVSLKNLGPADDTFEISIDSLGLGSQVSLKEVGDVTLGPDESTDIEITIEIGGTTAIANYTVTVTAVSTGALDGGWNIQENTSFNVEVIAAGGAGDGGDGTGDGEDGGDGGTGGGGEDKEGEGEDDTMMLGVALVIVLVVVILVVMMMMKAKAKKAKADEEAGEGAPGGGPGPGPGAPIVPAGAPGAPGRPGGGGPPGPGAPSPAPGPVPEPAPEPAPEPDSPGSEGPEAEEEGAKGPGPVPTIKGGPVKELPSGPDEEE